jgi:hypothetical protein
VGGWGAAQAGGIESDRRSCHMFGLRGAGPFVVVQSSGKRRVVVDFDKLNKETLKSAFRYETLKSLISNLPSEEREATGPFPSTWRTGFMPFPSTRTTGRKYVTFHRWKSIPVRGPSLRLDTKPFCVHQGDAPSSGAGFPFPHWRGYAFGGNAR